VLKTVISSIISASATGVNSVLFKLLGYYDNGLFVFAEDTNQKIELVGRADPQPTPKVLIVARRHYNELNRSYPLESRSEVKKLIKLEYADQRVHYKIGQVENGKTRVNIWIFNPEVPAALLTLPESLLFSASVEPNQILQVNAKPVQFLVTHNNLLFSQLSGALIVDPQSFSMSVGMPNNPVTSELASSEIAGVLLKAIKTVGLANLSLFFALPKVTSSAQTFKSAVIPAVLIFAVYLMASSAYLVGYKVYLQGQIDKQSEGIDTALEASANMDVQLERYQHIQRFMAEQVDVAPVWLVMAEVFPETKLSRFELNQGRFVLAGQTERATSLLESLNNNPNVKEARFDNPTRNSRGKEYFVISFTVNPLDSDNTDKEVITNDARH
jgi:hypothetical protein